VGDSVPLHYIDKNGETTTVQARVGMNLLRVAHANDIDLEGQEHVRSPGTPRTPRSPAGRVHATRALRPPTEDAGGGGPSQRF